MRVGIRVRVRVKVRVRVRVLGYQGVSVRPPSPMMATVYFMMFPYVLDPKSGAQLSPIMCCK